MKGILMTRKHFNVLLLSILSLVIIQLVVSMQASALTYQNSVDVEFTFNPAISISLSDADLIINNLTPGSSSDSNIITVGVSTNAGYGYYMTATVGTSTGNTNLNSTTTSNVFTNLSSNATTLNDIPADRWGYSYSKDNGTTWVSGDTNNTSTGYNGLPLDNNDNGATGVALLQTDSYTNSDSIKFKIAAHASPTQATGTYTNVINFYAVANPEPTLGPESCTAGKICYHKNALTTVEGTMGEQTAASDGGTTTLLASNFSRTGYGFAGWSDTYDYSGNLYGPQEEITIPTGTASNGLSLYAIWIKSAGSIQDATKVAQICSSLTQSGPSVTRTLNSVSALTDIRDNQTYAIAKLADGKCWMIENLRLDNTAQLTTDNTNNPLNDGTSVTLKHNYTDTQTYNTLSATSSVAYDENNAPDGWCKTNSAACNNQSRLRTDNTTNRALDPTTNANVNLYGYGHYYNFYSATAGRGIHGFSTNNNSTVGDLCPIGWRLPKGGDKNNETNNDFWTLTVTALNGGNNPANYSSDTVPSYSGAAEAGSVSLLLRSYPNNYLYSGNTNGASINNRGSGGVYKTSTVFNANSNYSLRIYSDEVWPGTYYSSKYFGRSIRCVRSNT